jgi:hypothetical protein
MHYVNILCVVQCQRGSAEKVAVASLWLWLMSKMANEMSWRKKYESGSNEMAINESIGNK